MEFQTFLKAEFSRWQSLLQKYAKRSIYHMTATPMRMIDDEQQRLSDEIVDTEEVMETCGPTIIQVRLILLGILITYQ